MHQFLIFWWLFAIRFCDSKLFCNYTNLCLTPFHSWNNLKRMNSFLLHWFLLQLSFHQSICYIFIDIPLFLHVTICFVCFSCETNLRCQLFCLHVYSAGAWFKCIKANLLSLLTPLSLFCKSYRDNKIWEGYMYDSYHLLTSEPSDWNFCEGAKAWTPTKERKLF